MSDRTIVRLVRAVAAAACALGVVGSALFIAAGQAASWWSNYGVFMALISIFFGASVWLVVPHQPRNAVVWIMAASAFAGSLYVFLGWSGVAVTDDPRTASMVLAPSAVPAELPTTAAWLTMGAEAGANVAVFLWLTFGLLLFPDGSLPSRRWRPVGVLSAVGLLLITLGAVWSYRPGNTTVAQDGLLLGAGIGVGLFAVLLSLAALIVRFRRSIGSTRDQFKWIVWGASVFVAALLPSVLLGDTRYARLVLVLLMVAEAVFLSAYGIAVGRYRLFDIDVVISRTVVVAGLAAFITVVYAVLVGAVGLILGHATDAALPLSIAATVVVAIAFQPVRQRMRRWADRLVYGDRATPYEVLSRFAERMRDAVATEDLIPQMARLLTQGTGARRATVWMDSGDELRPVATWPEEAEVLAPVERTSRELTIPGVDRLSPVEHEGELLGAVTVTMPRGEALTPTEERLVDDVASQAGLVLRNARLTADLVETIQQLRSSRQRLVAAQDQERRRLERDIHDGAQQELVALAIKQRLLAELLERDPGRAQEMLSQIQADTTGALENLRDLARGIYPPLLADKGLAAALRAQAPKAAVAVTVEADGIGRYPQEVEAAVYFCVLEALQNVAKYANATSASVRLRTRDNELAFEVADDGDGFDPQATTRGSGLQNMADRLAALGGSLDVRSAPGAGTTVEGRMPATSV
jgi:signal transduction histidine kinase